MTIPRNDEATEQQEPTAGTITLGGCLALPNKVNMHIPFKPATPLLNMDLRETLARYKSVGSALSILAKTGNNPTVH